GGLRFVAAWAAFVAGPSTLAAMAVDEWVPKRFKNLSERLVTQNGVLTMGLAAAAVLAYTKGAVALLVVMYSINVFLTFTLSQFGMARHWLESRRERRHWRRRLAVEPVGAVLTAPTPRTTAGLLGPRDDLRDQGEPQVPGGRLGRARGDECAHRVVLLHPPALPAGAADARLARRDAHEPAVRRGEANSRAGGRRAHRDRARG